MNWPKVRRAHLDTLGCIIQSTSRHIGPVSPPRIVMAPNKAIYMDVSEHQIDECNKVLGRQVWVRTQENTGCLP